MKNRILSFVLVVSIITSLITAIPFTANAYTEDIYTYTVANGEATITGCNNSASVTLDIPSTLGGYSVTSIDDYAFSYCYSLTSITIPNSVTSIGDGAFYFCYRLTSITIPNSVTSIGDSAFYFCASLTSITIPNSVTSIGDFAFYDCENLTSITIPNSVTSIGDDAFSWCLDLTSITVDNNNAYYSSDNNGVLYNKAKTTLMQYPIGKQNDSFAIPNSVTRIGGDTFSHCHSLTSITIPNSVTSIGDWAFDFCASLTSITVDNNNAYYSSDNNGVLYNKAKTTLMQYPIGKQNDSFAIPNSVTSIGGRAFSYCHSLTSITIPNSVTSIGWCAFWGCESLTDVYYMGSEEEWKKISISSYNDCLTNATIHYNHTSGEVAMPTSINEVTIIGHGKAYGRFLVKNTDGTIAKNKPVYYRLNGWGRSGKSTDEHGYLTVGVGSINKSDIYNIEISGNGIETTTGVLKVNVVPLKFKSNYEATLTTGATASVGIGVGGSIGNLEAEAKAAEVGVSGSSKKSLKLSQERINNKNKLSITSTQNYDAAIEAKAGLFANAGAKDIAGLEISAGDVHGKASYGTTLGMSFEDDDFKLTDNNDIKNLSVFMLCALLESANSNVATRYIIDKINAPVNSYQKGSSVYLGAGASLGAITASAGGIKESVTLAGIDGNCLWTNSTTTMADKSKIYNSGISANTSFNILSVGLKYNDSTIKPSTGTSAWKKQNANNASLLANEDKNGKLVSLGLTTTESAEKNIFWSKFIVDNKETYTYTGDAAIEIANSYEPLSKFSKGDKAYFTMKQLQQSSNAMTNSDKQGAYSAAAVHKKGIDVNLSASIKLLLEIGGKIGISGIESYEYENKNGIFENNTVYVQVENDIQADVENEFFGVEDIFEIIKNKISDMLTDLWNKAEGFLDDVGNSVIQAGNAVVEGASSAGKWVVSVFTPKSSIKTMSLLAVENEFMPLSASSVAPTIGDPYIISVEDEAGNKITDFTSNPLTLTIEYTNQQLNDAGVTDLNNISIMRWDDEKCVYIKMGGTIDTANNCVKLSITEPGQYILAVDNCPPAVTQFKETHNGANPEITAIVSDMSGISAFEFYIDGSKILDNSNFESYYSYTTSEFKYPANGLSHGEHTAKLYVADTFGNEIEQEITFTVDTTTPEISAITDIADIITGKMVVRARVTGENISSVFLNTEITDVFGNTTKNAVEMAEMDGKYSADMPSIENGYSVDVWVSAYNISGNKAESEKQHALVINKIDDNPAVAITKIDNGNISVKCIGFDDITNTKVYLSTYDNGGNLMQIKTSNLANDIIFNDISDAPIIKAFVWKNMKPLCKSSIAIK